MWYEILPATACLFFFVSFPATLIPAWNKFYRGTRYNKSVDDYFIRHYYRRDCELTGDPYKHNGLDALPDEPPKKI